MLNYQRVISNHVLIWGLILSSSPLQRPFGKVSTIFKQTQYRVNGEWRGTRENMPFLTCAEYCVTLEFLHSWALSFQPSSGWSFTLSELVLSSLGPKTMTWCQIQGMIIKPWHANENWSLIPIDKNHVYFADPKCHKRFGPYFAHQGQHPGLDMNYHGISTFEELVVIIMVDFNI